MNNQRMSKSSEQWETSVEAKGIDPRSFVFMGNELAQLMDLADQGLAPSGANMVKQQAPSVDWAKAYQDSPQVFSQIAQIFDPTLGAAPSSECVDGVPPLGEIMAKAEGIMARADSMTDQRTGCFTEEAMQTKEVKDAIDCVLSQLGPMLVELRVAMDQVLALMTWRTTMGNLLKSVEGGDDAMLFKVLSVNPLLAYHPGIARRVQQATADEELEFLRKMQKAIAHRPHRLKNGKPGFIMVMLWEAGLKYLTYTEIHGYLEMLGHTDIPSPAALERYAQRLGLKKYHVDPEAPHENE